MNLYRFVKKEGNSVRIGDFDFASLEAKLQEYLDNGYEIATAEDWDRQLVEGARAGMIPDPNLPVSEEAPVEVAPEAPAEPAAEPQA